MKQLGGGVVLFENSFTVNNHVLNFLDSIDRCEFEKNYSPHYGEDGSIDYFFNRSGHRYMPENLNKSSSCLSMYHEYNNSDDCVKFFQQCDVLIYNLLLEYLEMFPMLLPCIWWRTKGHPLIYRSGAEMGLHCDNDINYQPGFEPSMQLGMRHVVASMCYLNDDYEGGEIIFPYLDVVHRPKSGDVLMFPSNYVAAHKVMAITAGIRFAYLQYFGQGSSSIEHGVFVQENSPDIKNGQVWEKQLFNDYRNHILFKYGENGGELLLPLQRQHHSSLG